jgi:putative transposase
MTVQVYNVAVNPFSHTGAHTEILKGRKEVYEKAKQKHPERWSRSTRDWSAHESVALNPMREKLENDKEK